MLGENLRSLSHWSFVTPVLSLVARQQAYHLSPGHITPLQEAMSHEFLTITSITNQIITLNHIYVVEPADQWDTHQGFL